MLFVHKFWNPAAHGPYRIAVISLFEATDVSFTLQLVAGLTMHSTVKQTPQQTSTPGPSINFKAHGIFITITRIPNDIL